MQQYFIGQIAQICCDINTDTKYGAMTIISPNMFSAYVFSEDENGTKREFCFAITLNGDEKMIKKLLNAVNVLAKFYREAIENENKIEKP